MKKLKTLTALTLLASIVTIVPTGCTTTEHSAKASAAYPTTKCVVSGEDLGDSPYTFVSNGQTVKLCCKDCLAKFNEDPSKYLAKLNESK
jgi:hypothetical protein